MKTNLKNGLKEYYDSKELSDSKMKLLKDIGKTAFFERINWKLPAFLGGVVSCVLIFSLMNLSSLSIEEKIAKEVSYNHLKGMPPEVLTASYSEVNEALDRLNFKVFKSKKLGTKFELVGARYCSVMGKIAAQLKLKEKKSDKMSTLYLFKLEGKNSSIKNLSLTHKEKVNIEIWTEGTLGFALAN